jgi:glucose-6-phosphate dehydrogenase assembly protein OpcA
MPATIEPETILKELADLWVSAGKHEEGEETAGVLRACTMTVIVVADQGDDFSALGETLAALMPEHPSRLIVIRVNASSQPGLESRVFAQCWMPFGMRQQICSEQVEITASDASLPGIPPVVLSIVAPDLPVVLWWRSPRLFDSPDYRALQAMADKVILDSQTFENASQILRALADRSRKGPALADLSWTRMTRWRGLISQVAESHNCASHLPEIKTVRIAHSAEEPPVWTYYFGAWLLDGLEKVGAKPQLEIARDAANGVFLSGPDFQVSITRLPGDVAEFRVNAGIRRIKFPEPTDYLLMREELSITGRDPIFEKTLVRAASVASNDLSGST